MEPEQNHQAPVNQEGALSPQKSKKGKKTLFLFLAVLVAVAVFGAAGWKWYGQIQEYREKQDRLNQQVSELQSELQALKQPANTKNSVNSASVVEKDAQEIDEALLAECNTDAKEKYVYVTTDENEKEVTKVTVAMLQSKHSQLGSTAYVNGYAMIGIGCRPAASPEEGGGGANIILQRQSDGSWKKLFGLQDVPLCTTVNQYKIPKEILNECYSNDTLVKNTN